MTLHARPLIAAGTTLGIGLGGFVDGIVFHQLLQLHNMLSDWLPKTTIPNVEVNMFWDGVFHALTWIVTVAGLAKMSSGPSQPVRTSTGEAGSPHTGMAGPPSTPSAVTS